MSTTWFKQWGWFYRPVAWQGIVVLLLTMAFCAQVFIAINLHAHSVSDLFYNWFPYVVCSFGLLNWIAGKTSVAR